MEDGQPCAERVCEEVGVGEPVLLELCVEDLDLQLEGRRVQSTPRDRLRLRHACAAEKRGTKARQVIATKSMAEFVLVAEILVPIGVEEKSIGPLPGPPRVPHVVVKHC